MNTLDDFINGLSFRFVQPETRLPPGYSQCRKLLNKLGLYPDVLNTRLPPIDPETRSLLRELCAIPRMSTIAISALIRTIIAAMPADQAFLNIGVWNGFTFFSAAARQPQKTCIAVDNFSIHGGPRDAFRARFERYKTAQHRFYDMDYVKYLKEVHRERLGFYIYDGPHSYEHQLKNLEIAEPFFADGCLVLVDDTNDDRARRATEDFLKARPGSYEVLLDQRTARNCHPTFWNGVMVFRKKTQVANTARTIHKNLA